MVFGATFMGKKGAGNIQKFFGVSMKKGYLEENGQQQTYYRKGFLIRVREGNTVQPEKAGTELRK